jgi:hypothetical protein
MKTTHRFRVLTFTLALALGIWTLAAVDFAPVSSNFQPGDTVSAEAFNELFGAINDNFTEAQTAINNKIDRDQPDSVSTAMIQDGAVTAAKLEEDIAIQGSITNAVGSGLPLAFGVVEHPLGLQPTIRAGTSNVTSVSYADGYRITLEGVSYDRFEYVTVVTPLTIDITSIFTGSQGGDLTVFFQNEDGEFRIGSFHFVVFKP